MTKTILLITSEFPPLPGGIGNHACMLAKYLQKNGFEVSVVTDFRDKNQDIVFDAKQIFTVYRIRRNFFTYVQRIIKAFSLMRKNQTVICSGKFSLWTGALLKLFFPKKHYIAVIHGSELIAGNGFLNKLTHTSLRKFDRLIAVSNFTKNTALKSHPNRDIMVINNGIELPATEHLHHRPEGVHLLTVGNLTFRKGQQNVIQTLPDLLKIFPDIHYHCIGIPTEKKTFSDLAESLGVAEKITFYGVLSEEEKIEILKKSSIFVMLSEVTKNDLEGFGIAVIEANALGIPAIGSKNSGVADAIRDGFSGFLVQQNHSEEILEAVQHIMADYDTFSKNAREWSRKFDWNVIIKHYLEVIEK